MKVLIAGATGMVGGEAARILSSGGNAVRALVRSTSNAEKIAALKGAGIEVVEGDLRDRASLDAACDGVDAVISTVSAMPFSWQEGNTIGDVDRNGTIALIDAATAAGAKRFIYASFPHPPEPGFALGDAKAAAENHLRSCGIEYAILAANFFMEVWLSPAFGFDYANDSVTIFGDGTNRISWVSHKDVARTAAEAVSNPKAKNAVRWEGLKLLSLTMTRVWRPSASRGPNVIPSMLSIGTPRSSNAKTSCCETPRPAWRGI